MASICDGAPKYAVPAGLDAFPTTNVELRPNLTGELPDDLRAILPPPYLLPRLAISRSMPLKMQTH